MKRKKKHKNKRFGTPSPEAKRERINVTPQAIKKLKKRMMTTAIDK